jgi:hypothetical protein
MPLAATPGWSAAAIFASAVTALLAGTMPPRAGKVDPVVALRQEQPDDGVSASAHRLPARSEAPRDNARPKALLTPGGIG